MGLEKKEKMNLQNLLRTTSELHCARAFREPVDGRRYTDYYSVISQPMDLKTMRKKLNENQYASLDEFHSDIQLLFSNCRKYTMDPRNPVRVQCDELERKFEVKWAVLIAQDQERPVAPKKRHHKSSTPAKKRKRGESPQVAKNSDNSRNDVRKLSLDDELDMDYGNPQKEPESLFKMVGFEPPPEALKVVIQPTIVTPAPAKPTIRSTPKVHVRLPTNKEESVRAALTPVLTQEQSKHWRSQIEQVLQRYSYKLMQSP